MNIEEDIEIIKNHLLKIQQDTSLQIRISIENILADRERLQIKANKYDALKNKMKDTIEEINADKLNYSEDEWYLESDMKAYAIDKIKELLEEEEV